MKSNLTLYDLKLMDEVLMHDQSFINQTKEWKNMVKYLRTIISEVMGEIEIEVKR